MWHPWAGYGVPVSWLHTYVLSDEMHVVCLDDGRDDLSLVDHGGDELTSQRWQHQPEPYSSDSLTS
jgi:hypothetical protein